MNLILCGFKSCGKSHFGKRLSDKLKISFVDTDELLEATCKESCSALMKRIGPEAFREKEAGIISSLQNIQNSIIALGGGALLYPTSAKILTRLGKLVYLQLEKMTLKERLLVPPLPAFLDAHDPASSFEKMYEERVHLFEKLARVKISVEKREEADILSELARIYGQ